MTISMRVGRHLLLNHFRFCLGRSSRAKWQFPVFLLSVFVGIYDYCRQDLGQFQAHDFPKEGVPTLLFCQNFGKKPLEFEKYTPNFSPGWRPPRSKHPMWKSFLSSYQNDCEGEALIGIKSCGVLSLHVAMETGWGPIRWESRASPSQLETLISELPDAHRGEDRGALRGTLSRLGWGREQTLRYTMLEIMLLTVFRS